MIFPAAGAFEKGLAVVARANELHPYFLSAVHYRVFSSAGVHDSGLAQPAVAQELGWCEDHSQPHSPLAGALDRKCSSS